MGRYIGQNRLAYLWEKMKATFAKKSDLAAHPTARIYMGSCSTAAATNPKVCAVEEFPLDAEGKPLVGTLISVKFSATNTSTSTTPQLNVNDTGAIRIWYNNAVLAAAKSAYAGYANRYINYMYDGTYWVFLGHSTDNNTTYSALTQAKIDAGTETTERLISAKLLRDNFYTEGEVDDLLRGKEDAISDLADIRSGAALGATALQSFTESDPTVPSWAKQNTKPSYTASEVGALPDDYTPPVTSVNGQTGAVNLTIPSAVTESTVSGWGFTKNTGTYSKPSGGIPKTDLASAVQTSLGKADTALQEHQSLANYYTKSQVDNLLVPANTTIAVVSSLPASGSANTIYRVAGTDSYTDYGWDGTQFVALATYNTAYDAGGALS